MTELPPESIERLVSEAIAARKNAYAPHSAFAVGAAILGQSGRIFPGCNVENASYGGTICAERAAVCRMIQEGDRSLLAIAVSGPMHDEAVMPCGICRQVLSEFAETETPVICLNDDGTIREALSLGALLPKAFATPHRLGRPTPSDI